MMPSGKLDWAIAPGIVVPEMNAVIDQVLVQVRAETLNLGISATDKNGASIPGQSCTVPMPPEVFASFAKAQTEAMWQALISLPSEFFTERGLPDFSKATYTP